MLPKTLIDIDIAFRETYVFISKVFRHFGKLGVISYKRENIFKRQGVEIKKKHALEIIIFFIYWASLKKKLGTKLHLIPVNIESCLKLLKP